LCVRPASAGKPAIAQRLEAESAALAARKAELTPEKLQDELQAADSRRAKVLEEKVEKARELEGHGHASQQQRQGL